MCDQNLSAQSPPEGRFIEAVQKAFLDHIKRIILLLDVTISIMLMVTVHHLKYHKHEYVQLTNLSSYCGTPAYNKPPTQQEEWGYWSVILNFVFLFLVVVLLYWRLHMYYKRHLKTFVALGTVTWAVSVGVLIMIVLSYVIQIYAGVLSPNYFTNVDLNEFYCVERFEMNDTLIETDRQLRLSFPSLDVAMEAFYACVTLIFYVDFEFPYGPHTYQGFISFLFAIKCFVHGAFDYYCHYHHFTDVVAGALIGTAFGFVTGRTLYGSCCCMVIIKPLYWVTAANVEDDNDYEHRGISMVHIADRSRVDINGNEYQEHNV